MCSSLSGLSTFRSCSWPFALLYSVSLYKTLQGSRALVEGLSLLFGRGGLLRDFSINPTDQGANPALAIVDLAFILNLCHPLSSSLMGVLREAKSQGL